MAIGSGTYGFIVNNISVRGPLPPGEYEETYETAVGVLGPDGERYRMEGDDLVITFPDGHEERIENFNNGDNGIKFYEGDDEIEEYDDSTKFRDPIVIDLDGDGVEFIAPHSGPTYFDYDGNGFAERTAWASPDDGLLVVDLNDDGKITEAGELFAEASRAGFNGLAVYDSNGDGTIDASDTNFADLKIWQDANCDGITDDGEMRTLTEVGIASIDLAGATSGGTTDTNGVTIRNTSSVTLSNGNTSDLAVVDFASNSHDTRYTGETEVDPTLSGLFKLNGFGNVRDLDVAMTEDPVLRGQVEALDAMTIADAASLGQAVEAMILRWHRVEGVVEDDRGQYVDARHVAAMEAYAGQDFSNPFVTNGADAARADAGSVLQHAWDIYHSKVTARILAQTDLGQELFPELNYYSMANLELDADTSVTTVMERMATHAPEDGFGSLAYWISMTLAIQSVRDQFTEQGTAFITAANAVLNANGVDYNFDALRQARIGLDGGEVIIGQTWDGESVTNFNGNAHDTLIVSGTGDDRIIDNGGTNTLVYGEGRGNDIIQTGWSEDWIIDLVDLNPDDIEVLFLSGANHAAIKINSTGETLTIRDIARNGQISKSVTIKYADGTQSTIGEDDLIPDLETTDGDDRIIGTSADEVIEAGKGDDILAGGGGSDTYVLNQGDGADTISESTSDSSMDKIKIGVNFSDVTISFVDSTLNSSDQNLKITLSDGTSVTVLQFRNTESPIEIFEFSDVTLTFDEMLQLSDLVEALEGDGFDGYEIVNGTDVDAESHENTSNNEVFLGGGGSDHYEFSEGNGSDAIFDEVQTGDTNSLTVDADYEDVIFGLHEDNVTLKLSDGSFLVIAGGEDESSINQFIFQDLTVSAASVREQAELDQLTIFGTDGDDTLIADDVNQYTDEDNTLIGGLGDDFLDGGAEADTYIYNSGDGNDTIHDDGYTSVRNGVLEAADRLIIHGISPDDVSISRVEDGNDDLVLTFNTTGETITIQNQLENRIPESLGVIPPDGTTTSSFTSSSEVEEIIFDNGTTWTADIIRKRLLAEASTDGNDTINGFDNLDDTLEAGLGDDTIAGLSGSDTYVYNAGDGHDTIQEVRRTDTTDVLKLVGIDPADMIVTKDGVDVVLTFAGAPNDSIRLTEQLNAISPTFFNYDPTTIIEQIVFDDDTTLSDVELRDAAYRTAATSGDDTISGTHTHETLFLSAGNDTLSGLRGNDLYLREAGVTGDDILADGGIISFDTLRLEGITVDQVTSARDGSNIILTLPNGTVTLQSQLSSLGWDTIEQIIFDNDVTWDVADITASVFPTSGVENTIEGDATDETLTGTNSDDTIDGKGGDDTLNGGLGSDLFIFGVGSGNDTIEENGSDSRLETDRLQLTGLNEDDVTVSRVNADDISITINSSGETVTLSEEFDGSDEAIEYVNFADGTVWHAATLVGNAWIRGTEGDDSLTTFGSGNFTFFADKGDDNINGSNRGSHTFVFDVGDGEDVISTSGGDEKIIIRGVARENITFQREMVESNGSDLIIHYGNGDQITVSNYLPTYTSEPTPLELHLDDDTVITAVQMLEAAQILGTDGPDTINGTSTDDTIMAGKEDDAINGLRGSDTYLWALGDGSDGILAYKEDINNDVLKFTDLTQNDLEFSSTADDHLSIKVKSSNEIITVLKQFDRSVFDLNNGYGVSKIEFSDGTSISRAWLERNVPDQDVIFHLYGTDENDTITGNNLNEIIATGDGNDTLSGEGGVDVLNGGDGSDVYIWHRGFGNDTIEEGSYDDGIDTLRIASAKYEEFTIGRSLEDYNDLVLTHKESGETITLKEQLSYLSNIEKIEFQDFELTREQININYPYLGTDGDDHIISTDYYGEDTFEGLKGDDIIEGRYDADTYVWTKGDGNDLIIEPSPFTEDFIFELDEVAFDGAVANDGAEADDGVEYFEGHHDINILRLKGVTESDISFARHAEDDLDLLVKIASSGEQIQIVDQLSINEGLIKKIVLDDESEISLAGLAVSLQIIGTDEYDELTGGFAGETFDGKKGDDYIDAGGGSDTIIWRKGDGNDDIFDTGKFANEDILQLVDVASDGVEISRGELPSGSFSDEPTVDDLIITITATSETIIIRAQFSETTTPGGGGGIIVGSPAVFASAPLARSFNSLDASDFDEDRIPGIEIITFSDDQTLTREAIAEQLDPEGTRIIGGTDGHDTIEGTSSNDLLIGGRGGDTYKFDRGSSEDTILDSGGNDFIEFGPGITPEALLLQRIDDDLLIEVAGQDRLTLTVSNQFDRYAYEAVEGIRFDSGLVWSEEDIKAIVLNGYSTNGDDVIRGYDSDDNIQALGGNDEIFVEDGTDIVDGGDGYDTVVLSGYSSQYTIEATSNGYLVTDKYYDEQKILTNVEAVRFYNGTVQSLVPNVAPEAGSVSAVGFVNQALTILAHDVLSEATDPEGENLSLVSVSGAVNGSVTLNVDGDIIFTPDADFSGEASFSYEITDGTNTISGTAAVVVSVPNTAPTVANELADQTSQEDMPVNFTIPADAFSDADGDDLALSAKLGDGSALPAWLSFDADSRTFSGTPPTDFDGELDVTVTASDGAAEVSDTFTLDITPVNDAPVVANALADQSSDEDTAVNFTIPADAFSDVDSTDLTLSAALEDGSALPDWLAFNADSRSFSGTPPLNHNGEINVTVTASDGELDVKDTFTLDITSVNDAPTVANTLVDQSSDEDTEVNFTIPEDAFSDVDTAELTYSTGDIPDWLDFNNTTRTFQGTPPLNFNGAIDVTVKAFDGEFEVSDTFTLTITPVNDAPIVANALADQTSREDEAVNFTIPADAFSDVDDTDLTLTATGLPDWLSFDADTRTFSGTPPQDSVGSFDVTVTASDGELTASDAFTLNITPVNDAPIVANELADQSSPEDTAVSITIPDNAFSDVDGDDLTYSATLDDGSALPLWLTFDAASRTFSGTPPQDFNGAIDVSVTASDSEFEVSDTFTLDITPVNDAPIVANALADQTSPEDEAVSIIIPADAFSDVDSTELTLSAAGLPDWLSFDADSRTLSGTPPQDFNGAVDITVTASDGEFEASDTFTLDITAVNDAPIVANALADQSSPEDTAVSFAIPADAFTDVDSDDLTLSATGLPDWLSFDADSRTFSGTPPVDFNGAIDVSVTATDGEHEVSDTFTLDITPVNDGPVANADDGFETSTGAALTIAAADLLANDTDVDDDDLTISSVATSSGNGTVTLDADLNVVYTSNADFSGEDSFTYTVSDGNGGFSTATVSVTVAAGNVAPIVANEIEDQTSEEDTAVSFTIPEDTFSDADGDELTYSATLDGGSALPSWLTFDADTRTFSGTPPLNFDDALDVTVTASDGALEASDTFTLDITGVNDAPVLDNELADQTSEEDTAVSFTIPTDAFSDPDGDELTYSAGLAEALPQNDSGSASADEPATVPLPDWLSFNPDTLTFSGTPPLNFFGSIDVVVTASDGELSESDTFTLEITPVNDAPVLAGPLDDQTSEEDTAVSFTIPEFAFTDVDNNLTLRTSTLPAWLAFDASTLTFSGTPPQDFTGTVDVTVTASDGEYEVSDTFALEITPVNDGPVAADDDGIEADAGTALTIAAADLLANDSDVEGDDLNIIAVESTSGNAEVSLDGDRNVVYTASDDFDGDDSFTYTISDGNGGTATATVSVSVEGDVTDPYEGWVVGTTGRDYLYGNFYSSNRIYGDDGNDRIFGGFRSDQLDGGEGNDRIYGRWGNDIINGDGGNDRLYGGSGNDTLNGGDGNDRLYGSWGNDTLNGGEGNDQIWGGWGQDNFVFNTGDGADTVRDFSTGFSWWWFRSAGDTITLDVDGIENYDDVLDAASQNGRHTTFDFGDGDSLTLRYTRLSSLDQDDFNIL